MKNQKNYLGILDWGIGGFGFFNAVKKKYPNIPILYFSDSGFIPYGKVNKIELHNRIKSILLRMKDLGAKQISVACHSASTVAKDILIEEVTVNTIYNSTGNYLTKVKSTNKAIGLIGGIATIKSKMYSKFHDNLVEKPAQSLSAFIEQGEINSLAVHEAVIKVIQELSITGEISSLVLACTHYPAISNIFQQYLSNVEIVDPVNFMLLEMKNLLKSLEKQEKSKSILKPKDVIFTTGDPSKLKKAAYKAFNINLDINDIVKLY